MRPPSKRCPDWYWRAVKYEGGREQTVWTGRATREEAERTVVALMAAGELGVKRQQQEDIRTIRDLMECWLGAQEQRADLAPLTYRNYERVAKKLAKAIGGVAISAVHRGTLERYRDGRLGGGGAPSTVGLEFQVLQSAWRWGQDLGFCPLHRIPTPRLPKATRYNRRTPTRGEVAQAVAQMHGWPRLAVVLLYATGARPGEVTHLKWGDVDLQRGLVRLGLYEGARKTGERTVPIPPETVEELKAWGSGEADTHILRDAPSRAARGLGAYVKTACKRAGIEPWSPMGLRRLAEDELYRRVGDPSAAAAYLGHSPVMAMKHYRRATAQDLRSAMEKAEMGRIPRGEVIELDPRTQTAHKKG